MDLSEVLKQVETALEAMLKLRFNLPHMADGTALKLGEVTGLLMGVKILIERELAGRPH